MQQKTIGVLGGYGKVGKEAAAYLLRETPHDILLGGRTRRADGMFPAERVSFRPVDVFQAAALDAFCNSCDLLVNCAGPAAAVGDTVAVAALKNGTHYVDPGGYNPLYHALNRRREELREKGLVMVLAVGILPGLSELFPIYEAGRNFDSIQSMEYAYTGRDLWTHNSAYDIAWGVGNIGKGEAPVYYEQGKAKEVNLLASGRRLSLPQPVGRYKMFPVFREELRGFVEREQIRDVRVYGNNWGLWVTLATIAVKIFGWYKRPWQLHQAAELIVRAAKQDLKGKKPGFMLHARMQGLREGRPCSFSSTLYFEETYRATGICAAIAAQLAAEGALPPGCRWASQIPDVDLFMERFLRQGYSIVRSEPELPDPREKEAAA